MGRLGLTGNFFFFFFSIFQVQFFSIFSPKNTHTQRREKKRTFSGRPTGHNFGHPLDRKQTFFHGQPDYKTPPCLPITHIPTPLTPSYKTWDLTVLCEKEVEETIPHLIPVQTPKPTQYPNIVWATCYHVCTYWVQLTVYVRPETLYHRDDALLYIAYVMLIWAAPIPADRWHYRLWP